MLRQVSLGEGLLAGALAILLAALTMLGWNVLLHGRPVVDWGTATVLGIIVGAARGSAARRLQSREP